MAEQYVTAEGRASSFGTTFMGRAYYTVSDTNDTYTITVTSVNAWPQLISGRGDHVLGYIKVTFAGKTICENVRVYTYYDSAGVTINKSASVTKNHSTQRQSFKVEFTGVTFYHLDEQGLYRIQDNLSASKTENISVSARTSYAVTFNANGGSSAPSSQTKWYGESLTLSSSKPTRTNHVFKRWNTNTSDTGSAYNPGATYTGNAALALYAIWYPPYSVTFNANGGSGAPSAQVKVYNQRLTLSSQKPTRAGYVFKNWNTNTSDSGSAYNPGATYTGNAALALYAIWNPIISYDANGGTGAPASQTKTFGVALTLQSGTPTRTGYAFSGWNTAKDGSGTSYSAGGTMAASQNSALTLYAKWTKQPDPPTISSLTVVRSDSSGRASDGGTYCKVTAAWRIDTTNVSGNTATVTGKIQPQGGTARSFAISSGGSGTSGTATALVENCDPDTQYLVTITVTDKRTSTARAAILTRGSFIIDCKAGGKAMGIGSAAPDSGIEIGWPTQFDEAVGMLAGLSVGADLTVVGSIVTDQLKVFTYTADVFTASSGWTVVDQYARVYGKVVSIRIGVRPTSEQAAGGGRTVGTVASAYRPVHQSGFSDDNGFGSVNGSGSTYYRNVVALSTSTVVYVGLTYLKA